MLSSSPTKQRRPSRGGEGLNADGGLFELFGGRQFWPEAAGVDRGADKNKDFMVPSPPRYTFTEERPQTRGNQSHQGAVDAAGTGRATQSGRRSRRVPRNKRLEALSPPDSSHSKQEPQIIEPLNDSDILNSGAMNRQMTAGSKEYDQRADPLPPWHNPRGNLISPQGKGTRADRIVIVDSAAAPQTTKVLTLAQVKFAPGFVRNKKPAREQTANQLDEDGAGSRMKGTFAVK